MEEILYVKIAQNIPVAKRQVTFHDLATLHCTNKKVVQELNQMVFYTLPAHGPQKTMFTIAKVYEVIHQKYPNLKIENLGERDFVIDYEKPDEKEKQKKWEYVRTIFVSFIVFMGAAFTIMTFNEDVSVADVFDKVYRLVLGQENKAVPSLRFFMLLVCLWEFSFFIIISAGIKLRMTRHRFRLKCTHMRSR